MPYFLLFVSIVLCVCKSSSYNYYAKSEQPDVHGLFRFNFICYAIAAVLLTVFSIGGGISLPTVLCSLGYAITVLLLQSLLIVAMKTGSMSTTSLLNLYGMVIPAVAGPIFWAETFGLLQVFGLVAMVVSIFFLRDTSLNEGKKGKYRILLGIACFLLSGNAGLLEKIHQSTYAKDERFQFLTIAYCTMFLISLFVFFITKKNAKAMVQNKKRFITVGIVVGIITGAYSSVNLFLAGTLDSLIYYPVANGGALLFTVLISVLLFRERPTSKKIIGFVLGLISVVLLCFPTI